MRKTSVHEMTTKAPKILHLVRALDVGGLEQVVIDLIQGARASRQFDPQLGCLIHAGSRWQQAGVEDGWIGIEEADGTFLHLPTLKSLVRFIKKESIALIHSHNPVPHRYAFFASLLTGIPIIHSKHGRNYPKNPKAVWLNRLYTSKSKHIVAVSQNAANVCLEIEKIAARKVITIQNGVNTEHFKPQPEAKASLRQERNLPPDAFIVGTIGRLASEKDYPLLVRAFAQTFADVEEAHLLIVGDGDQRTIIEELAKKTGVEKRVHFPGMQTDTQPWYRCMDCFCLTSITEGTSITLLESAASGLPAVVADVGGNAEIVSNNESGFVVNPRDNIEQYKNAWQKLYEDPELRHRMGQAARQKILKDYSLTAMSEAYHKLYQKILNTCSSTA